MSNPAPTPMPRNESIDAKDPGQTASRADDLRARGRYQEGIALLESALHEFGPCAPLLFTLGNIYYDSGELGKAEAAYRRVLSLDDQHVGALNNLAVIYKTRGHIGAFVRTIRKATLARARGRAADETDTPQSRRSVRLLIRYGLPLAVFLGVMWWVSRS